MGHPFNHIVYSKNVIEFVTVSKEFCNFVEQSADYKDENFAEVLQKVLSLLYLKGLLLTEGEENDEVEAEKLVTELEWTFIRNNIAEKLKEADAYIDFYDHLLQETPEPVSNSISENLADVYQDIKDFIENYQTAITEIMNAGLNDIVLLFRENWGPKLLNSLRILHNRLYISPSNENFTTSEGEIGIDTKNWFISKRQNENSKS